MAEARLNFVYKLEGDVTEIDVYKLAPTLLALGDLIQESNRQINPEGRQIGVNVKPFRKGSFIVDLTLFSPSHIQQLLDFLTPHSLEQLNSLLSSIGLVGTGIGTTTMGAVGVIKFLRGKPKAVEELKGGEVRYTSQDNKSITVSGSVHSLLSNSTVTNNIVKIYVAPMQDQPSIDDVKTYLKGHEESAMVVDRNDVDSIRDFSSPTVEEIHNEVTKETKHEGVFLNPKRGSFDGDPKDWSFWKGDQIIVATIKDKDFLRACVEGIYRLNGSDLLTVDLLEKQRIVGTQVLKPIYEITRVIEYKKGDYQPILNMGD